MSAAYPSRFIEFVNIGALEVLSELQSETLCIVQLADARGDELASREAR
jgi:hypothetical protein